MKGIKSRYALFLILSSLLIPLLTFTSIPKVKGAELTLFEDDFESYQVGDFPSSGGWEMIFSGAGTQYQVIVDNVSASPTKSLQLLGQSSWACDTVKRFNTNCTIIGYEAQVLVEDIDVVDLPTGRVGFWSRAAPNIGRFYALVDFCGGGTIKSDGQVLQNYTANTWYKIRVILNKETRLFSVWIDDVLLLEEAFVPHDTSNIEAFGLASEMFGSFKAYFDDVKVFYVFDLDPKLELVPATGIAATTLVGSGFAPKSKISVTWDDTPIPTVPSPLITDGYGNFTAIISVLNQTTSGIYTVKAVDEIGTEANASFTVYSNVSPSSSTISVLSPENNTYNTTDIPLIFTINAVSWITYSVDEQTNVTITGNTNITGLADGIHEILVHANDAAGNMVASDTVCFTVDTTPPNITDVSQAPVNINGTLEEGTKVNATVTDSVSGVERVSLNYTDGNGTGVIAEMTNLEGDVWNGTIPAFPHGTNVTYIIIAEDKAGNTVTTKELYGHPNQYEVLPEFPLWIILPLFLVATASTIAVRKRISIPAFAKICNSIHKILS